jgi:hypothetical protein
MRVVREVSGEAVSQTSEVPTPTTAQANKASSSPASGKQAKNNRREISRRRGGGYLISIY